MSLPDDDFQGVVSEACLLEALALGPEQHTSVGVVLLALRWLKKVCESEAKPIQEITPEFVIQRITGKTIRPEDIALATDLAIKARKKRNR